MDLEKLAKDLCFWNNDGKLKQPEDYMIILKQWHKELMEKLPRRVTDKFRDSQVLERIVWASCHDAFMEHLQLEESLTVDKLVNEAGNSAEKGKACNSRGKLVSREDAEENMKSFLDAIPKEKPVWCEHLSVIKHKGEIVGWSFADPTMPNWSTGCTDSYKFCPICGAKRPVVETDNDRCEKEQHPCPDYESEKELPRPQPLKVPEKIKCEKSIEAWTINEIIDYLRAKE